MSYFSKRQEQQADDSNTSRFDFTHEQEIMPLLHSGFCESLPNDTTKSTLYLSIWFANGGYRARITDRQAREKAFIELGTLTDCFARIEKLLEANDLDWVEDRNYTA